MLSPASVAVVGASERPGNLGGDTVNRLVRFGFPGPIWPVNRSARPGDCRPRVGRDLPGTPDLVVRHSGRRLKAIRDALPPAFVTASYAGGLASRAGSDPHGAS
jgi:hypothetical protein